MAKAVKVSKNSLPLTIGQQVEGQVIRVSDDAFFVRLTNDEIGLVRREWLTTEFRNRKSGHRISRGAFLKASVRNVPRKYPYVLLDSIEILDDPWSEVEDELVVGAKVDGYVSSIQAIGVFAKLPIGVDAFVPIREIPGHRSKEADELLGLGDRIEAQIMSIDGEERKITISIEQHVRMIRNIQRKASRDRVFSKDLKGIAPSTQDSESANGPIDSCSLFRRKGNIQRVLILDDDEYHARAVSRWLKRLGYDVEITHSCDMEPVSAANRKPDLVFVSTSSLDTTTINLVKTIKQSQSAVQVVLLLDELNTGTEESVPDEYITASISKFEGIPALEKLISKLESDRYVSASDHKVVLQPETKIFLSRQEHDMKPKNLEEAIHALLNQAQISIDATAAVVFSIDQDTGEVKELAHTGPLMLDNIDLSDLRYSPVRGVVYDNELIFENAVSSKENEYRHLLPLMEIQSCIGLRMEFDEQHPSAALFFFQSAANGFDERGLQTALLTGKALEYEIRKYFLEEEKAKLRFDLLQGVLSMGLVHELNNHLTDAERAIRNLQLDYRDLQAYPRLLITNEQFREKMENRVNGSATALANLRKITTSFLGLLGSGGEKLLDINAVVDYATTVAESEANPDITVVFRPEKQLPHAIGVFTHLQQAVVNLMLNGIQQMKGYDDSGRILLISTHYIENSERPSKIRVVDTGPGIHRSDYRRIFTPGFSTRDKGAGLGLHITRNLVESMNGRIKLDHSVMFVGSSFLIELPAASTRSH